MNHVISDFIGKQIFELDEVQKTSKVNSGVACANFVQHIFGESALVCQKS